MAARVRATPSSTSSRQSQLSLPALEKSQFPLNERAVSDLNLLARKLDISKLQHYQKLALEKINESASEINDRLVSRTIETEKRKAKRTEKGKESGEIDAEEAAAIETLTERVKELTGRLEEEVRRVIDAQAHLAARQTILEEIGTKAKESADSKTVPSATQSTLGASQFRSQRNPAARDGSGGEVPEDGSNVVSATALLEATSENDQKTYQALTMRQKYAHHNDYISFKQLVHDSQHPEEDAPPLPHANTWFQDADDVDGASELVETNAAGEALSEESDLEAVSERVSTKCPITLREFVEPVTTKCKHTFEKSAIIEMISHSNTLKDGSAMSSQQVKRGLANGVRDRAVKCPVCTKLVAYADLRDDQIMIRRIKRAKAAETQHSDGDDDDMVVSNKKKRSRISQLAHTIDSDDASDDDEEPVTRVKRGQSEMPATQEELSDIDG